MANRLVPFLIENRGVRGFFIEITEGIPEMLGWRQYSADVFHVLGHALAAAPLLAADLADGARFNLQFQHGPNAVKMLVAQVDSNLKLRGMAKADANAEGDFQALLKGGTLACMLEPRQGAQGSAQQSYQAVVGIFGENLAEALEIYFAQSEQLPTKLRLGAMAEKFAGLMLQRLPEGSSDDDWVHVHHLVQTLHEPELLSVDGETVLRRLFAEDAVRVFPARPVTLQCQCSHAQISAMLLGLGEEELKPLLEERGEVEVTCEFCGRDYHYREVEVRELFAGAKATPSTTVRQ